ncbi:uncharacterized protein MYCFIDRAFT_80518 [Pseudocercospora fijiensis CIRAD86]|uniref:Uncharacterized protein n=1 Tax=Pseudocercospora fijiensis (strain CIRAD86) TaxID=383855 RepID=M2ZVA8_PSEFD|nr:uncharacterized protein MYCFIDRAFT_80518 [Pseudocercospora fijiensis CIRAD86]EME82939.1 hypothetical protein MYCFIDRAFT_80518 [Pseudocercospora fijiensis CIRAD86]
MNAIKAVGASADNENKKTVNGEGTQEATYHRDDECRLLDLAPELRNRIYRYVLCGDGKLFVTKDTREPGLLSACRQIRQEARSIWLLENEFRFWVQNLDFSIMAAFFTRDMQRLLLTHRARCGQQFRFSIGMSALYDWQKLMVWCKAVFEHRAPGVCISAGQTGFRLVVANALSMAAAHAKIEGATWATCLNSLQFVRNMAENIDARWRDG